MKGPEMKASDLTNTPPKVVIVGEAGCGKTALISQAGSGSYMFDFDDGMRTAQTLEDKFSSLRRSTEFDIYRDPNPADPVMWVRAKSKIAELISKPPRAICIDSLTGLAQSAMLYTMKTQKGDPFAIPKLPDYQAMVKEVDKFIILALAVKCPLLMSAHIGIADMDNYSIPIINSITKPHGRNRISWLMDEVLYMECRDVGQGKLGYFLSGRKPNLPVRTRSGFGNNVSVMDKGLALIFESLQYPFELKADQNVSTSGNASSGNDSQATDKTA